MSEQFNDSYVTEVAQPRRRRRHSTVPQLTAEQFSELNDLLMAAHVPSRNEATRNLIRGLQSSIEIKRKEGMTWAQITSIINQQLGTDLKSSTVQSTYQRCRKLDEKSTPQAQF